MKLGHPLLRRIGMPFMGASWAYFGEIWLLKGLNQGVKNGKPSIIMPNGAFHHKHGEIPMHEPRAVPWERSSQRVLP